ncbi:MAG: ferrous iron transport protein B [Armatimonadetes bacterium]|nr:ferrous iron transport protein B [Armatimonadota bacterium]
MPRRDLLARAGNWVANTLRSAGRTGIREEKEADPGARKRVLIVGSPNVGKSVLFNRLTGRYVVVSNYPGTTVEVSRSRMTLDGEEVDVVDTPGMYSLRPISDEERVGRRLLLNEHADVVLHVVDAKNLTRMLPFTLQLIECGLPVALVVNMLDEAQRLGITVDLKRLREALGIPVAGISALRNAGMDQVRALIRAPRASPTQTAPVTYDDTVEAAVGAVAGALPGGDPVAPRGLALLLLQDDPELAQNRATDGDAGRALAAGRDALGDGVETTVALRRHATARELAEAAMHVAGSGKLGLAERLSRLCTSPVTGVPVLALVIWFGLYQFVGVFGGGTLVGLLEKGLFHGIINPWVEAHVRQCVPWPWLASLFVGDYGIWTLGVTYAVALVFPIVGTFFLAFSVLEDSGYLPRLAMLVDRLFKSIGMSGKAVIPIVLGFGCDTMATLVTRILETRRERIIATFLLSLAIPCSAQLGVMTALLAGHSLAFGLWTGIMVGIFLLVGYLSARLMPGDAAQFAIELPPLRLPSPGNVAIKTLSRMHWYFLEVLPLFVLASVGIWLAQMAGLFAVAIRALEPVVHLLGLPSASAEAFLFGFFRRDYGAAGLYRLHQSGVLDGRQLLVSVVALTIFLPCVAQFLMVKKERGARAALGMSAFIFPFAVGIGALLNWALTTLRIAL